MATTAPFIASRVRGACEKALAHHDDKRLNDLKKVADLAARFGEDCTANSAVINLTVEDMLLLADFMH